jgi:hypothetical protein
VVTALGDPAIPVRVVEKGSQVSVATDDHVAALAAVPTIRAAHGHTKLTPE